MPNGFVLAAICATIAFADETPSGPGREQIERAIAVARTTELNRLQGEIATIEDKVSALKASAKKLPINRDRKEAIGRINAEIAELEAKKPPLEKRLAETKSGKRVGRLPLFNFEDAREGAIVRLESAEPRRSGIVDWTVQNVISNDEFVAVPNVAFQVYRKTGTAVTKIETGEIPVCFRHMGTQDFVDGKRLPIEGAFWIAARAKRGGRTLFVLEPIDAGEAGAPLHDDDDPPPKKKGDQKKSAPKVNRGGSKPAF